MSHERLQLIRLLIAGICFIRKEREFESEMRYV